MIRKPSLKQVTPTELRPYVADLCDPLDMLSPHLHYRRQ